MPNTDLTETTDTQSGVPTEPKKSDAASRILRALEKSRGDNTARLQIPTPVNQSASSESADQPPSELPKLVMPKIGVDAREALRSLSERQARRGSATENNDEAIGSEPNSETGNAGQLQQRTVSEILEATKPAVNAPLPGEARPNDTKSNPTDDSKFNKDTNSAAEAASDKSGKSSKSAKATKGAATVATSAKPSDSVAPQAKHVPETKKPQADAVLSPARSNSPAFEAPLLGMGPNPSQSFWANLPMVVKAGFAVLILGAAAGIYFKFSGQYPKRESPAQQVKSALVAAPMSGIGGWTANWGDPTKMRGRAISLFRPSLQHADYRIEFDAQIEAKAFGWVFRAKDPQNYYAYKLETVKPGLQPLVALARITVVSGVESQKHYTLLEAPVRPDTVFRVRMDSIGSEFTTRINDQLIEVWQDDRLRFGGVGLFSDPGERAQIRKVQIFEMR